MPIWNSSRERRDLRPSLDLNIRERELNRAREEVFSAALRRGC
jgi:hypothetical protein